MCFFTFLSNAIPSNVKPPLKSTAQVPGRLSVSPAEVQGLIVNQFPMNSMKLQQAPQNLQHLHILKEGSVSVIRTEGSIWGQSYGLC